MSGAARWREAVLAIVAKDLRLFLRDRFYVLVSVLSLVAFAALFWILPASVQSTASVGVHLPGGHPMLALGMARAAQEGFELVPFDSEEALNDAVAAGDDVLAGLSFPPGFLDDVTAGRETTVRVLLAGEAPEGLRPALGGAVRELAFFAAGDELPVALPDTEDLVVGGEGGGDREPLPLREQLRPLLLFVVLVTEMFALASLVAVELAQRTVSAVLATPVRTGQLLAAKALLGTLLAFGQVLLIAAVTGTLAHAPVLVVVTLLLGAGLVTGVGLLAGAAGQDFVATVFWSMLFIVPLAVPAFAVLFPGTPDLWIRALPSHGLVRVLVGATGHGEGWAEAWPHLAALAGWCAATLGVGSVVLGRRAARV